MVALATKKLHEMDPAIALIGADLIELTQEITPGVFSTRRSTLDFLLSIFLPIKTNLQTGTTYTVQASDNGKLIVLTNAAGITLTFNTGLGANFSCVVIQGGAGQITFAGTATRRNRLGHTKTAGQYGMVSFIAYIANEISFQGATI